ncbi:hypothetical protein FRC02_011563 [Tulasnella sp. 418]|nr:hypothetical protein FRC02_011563 [Tulasnella sp. 418]
MVLARKAKRTSANDVASHPPLALETPPSPHEASIPTTDYPKTPNSPLVASEVPKGEPSKHPTGALETPPSPHEASIPTTDYPKTPNSPLVASEVPKGEPTPLTLQSLDEDVLSDDIQMATNVDSLFQSGGVDQALPKAECEDCQRYREQLLQKEVQNRALSDYNNLLLQERQKGVRLLPRLFSSRTEMNSTAFASSDICESRPEYRGNTVYPTVEENSNTRSGCCVIQ